MSSRTAQKQSLDVLRRVLDKRAGSYRELNGADNPRAYLATSRPREDEEILTEPILADVLELVLGFPADAYFPQLGRSGLKPDFTPHDLVAHRFVLDAKSSTQDLAPHEGQIRRYIDQRQLDYGVLFNLRELRVYRRGERGHDPRLSFDPVRLWETASGEALLDDAELERLERFVEAFSHRKLTLADKVKAIQRARPWSEREGRGERIEIDLEFLVDRLRGHSRRLAEDAANQHDVLADQLAMNPGMERGLIRELELIALDLRPGTDPGDLPEQVDGYRLGDGLVRRAWSQYLLRVSQLALTRIVLYRSWEDVEFVESCLYDGGFFQVYERVGQRLRAVLERAFANGLQQYRWLYGGDNNYDWYRPSAEELGDFLYALIPVPLGKLDADVLGGLYESYVDEIDRDRLGQFYTPRSVVRFMLDRAGFAGPDGVFRIEGDVRHERRVLDFATGSGGFLVEAARRLIDEGGMSDDPRELHEALRAIVLGFHGCEISPFPYYLTEINLLLQVSRLLGRMLVAGEPRPRFALGVVHADTLTARAGQHESLEGLEPESRLDHARVLRDERFGLAPPHDEKQESFDRIREDGAFDLVTGNPPYVFESGNKVLFDRLRALPGWKDVYRGKSDYLYYFLQLASEKVAPGGRLCVITPAGWMNAGNADWLREAIAAGLRLDELYLFGSYRLFAPERGTRGTRRAPTPTVESAILVATKAPAPKSHRLRIVLLENEAEAARALSGDPDARFPDRDRLLEQMGRRQEGRAGRSKGILVHDVRQADLIAGQPWPIKHAAKDVAARVVRHLTSALDDAGPVEPLTERWNIFQGVQTGADAYTARIQKRVGASVTRRLAADGATTGEPIMELPPGRESQAPWKDSPELLARSPESRAILYGAIDDADYASLVWIGRDDQVPESVVAALERWRPVLASRAELARNPQRRWFETAWPRDKDAMRAPKVIALYRTDRGRFALDEAGAWQPSIKTTLCTAKGEGLSVAYLCGLLNSELLDLWYAVRGKTPWHVRRNYEPKPMARIPYRHVERVAKADETERLERLGAAVADQNAEAAQAMVYEIAEDLSGDSAAEAEAAAALEALVRALAANRRALLPCRALAPELERIVKDPWKTGPIDLDDRAAIASLPAVDVVSVRLDPGLSLSVDTDGALGKPQLDRDGLGFKRARQRTARVTGPPDRLALLDRLVSNRPKLLASELGAILIPRDLATFGSCSDARVAEVGRLLTVGRALVEAAERLVCRLYGLGPELEDAVVAHAVARSSGETR